MPIFNYKAKTKTADTVAGRVMASDKNDAVEKINQLGLVPVEVLQGKREKTRRLWGFKKIRSKELYRFSRQLVSLLRAGVPILRSLEAIAAQTSNVYFKDVIESIHQGIRGGSSFSDALVEYPKIFSELYVMMARAGEESGKMTESLAAVAEYLEGQQELASRIKSAMAYPLLMMVFGVGTVIFILTYVMPQITGLFVHLDQALPVPTIVVMRVSSFLVTWWWLIIILFMFVSGMLRRWSRTATGKKTLSRISIMLPFFGDFWKKVDLARLSRSLALLTKSGVSIVRSMQLSIPVMRNELLREEFGKCREELLAGRTLGDSLRQNPIIPPLVGHIIAVGEESGNLGGTFAEIAESYERDTKDAIKVLTVLMEPLMIVVVGGMIGFIVIAMLLPIFQLDVFAA